MARRLGRSFPMQAVAIAMIGLGCALAGRAWAGVARVAAGAIVNRWLRHPAAKIPLHLAIRDAAAYRDATESAIVAVWRR